MGRDTASGCVLPAIRVESGKESATEAARAPCVLDMVMNVHIGQHHGTGNLIGAQPDPRTRSRRKRAQHLPKKRYRSFRIVVNDVISHRIDYSVYSSLCNSDCNKFMKSRANRFLMSNNPRPHICDPWKVTPGRHSRACLP